MEPRAAEQDTAPGAHGCAREGAAVGGWGAGAACEEQARAKSEAWLLQGHSIPAARGEDKRGINMAKRQKQEQTFPPQLGGTELSVPQPGTQGQPKGSQGCLGWKPQGREGAELDVEHWGSCIPHSWAKEVAARGNKGGLSSSRSLYSPSAPAEITSLPLRAAVDGRIHQGQRGAGAGTSLSWTPAHGWASSAGHAGDTGLSPNPEPSRGTEE